MELSPEPQKTDRGTLVSSNFWIPRIMMGGTFVDCQFVVMHSGRFDLGMCHIGLFEDNLDGEHLEIVLLAEGRFCGGVELVNHAGDY